MSFLKKSSAPGTVTTEVVVIVTHGRDAFAAGVQVVPTTDDTEPSPVEMDSVDVVTKL